MSRGVAAGASTPYQLSSTNSGSPDSANLGTSERDEDPERPLRKALRERRARREPEASQREFHPAVAQAALSFRIFLSTLLTEVFGSAATISRRAGTLYRARFARQCARSPSASARAPGRSAT